MSPDFDVEIKLRIYGSIAETARVPTRLQLAGSIGVDEMEIAGALTRLREKKLVFLARDSGEIVMAPPFSAVPTAFAVRSEGKTYFANCVWDAYGIAAALHKDAEIDASCGCCGEPMRMAVRDGACVSTPGVAHFAVPARHWWDDLTFT
jgi:Alkylmercury lyase